ncbi:hypothetical protein BSF_05500 [Bacillus subtilis]|nr:hypothetical protein BSF_05500 [Bacillus subtilis]
MLAQSSKSRQLFEMMATLYTDGFHEESPRNCENKNHFLFTLSSLY